MTSDTGIGQYKLEILRLLTQSLTPRVYVSLLRIAVQYTLVHCIIVLEQGLTNLPITI